MYQGSCLCGQVRLKVAGPIESVIHCHCSRCRKSSGTAYATNGFIARSGLTIETGAELIRSYQSAPGKLRHFCGNCGSPLYSSNEQTPERLRIRLGVLDSDIVERPVSHNFMSSRANWDEPDAVLPHSDGYEAGRD